MIAGFTGTRRGMSPNQLAELSDLFFGNVRNITMGIHGGCVGADAEFHGLCRDYGVCTEIRPGYSVKDPSDMSLRAGLKADRTRIPDTHFRRNRSIVNSCDFLIAAPYDLGRQTKGGTWYTIGYAKSKGREIIILKR